MQQFIDGNLRRFVDIKNVIPLDDPTTADESDGVITFEVHTDKINFPSYA